MHLGKSWWSSELTGLFIRLPLGLYFLLAGKMKLDNLDQFVTTVSSYNILQGNLAKLYGTTIPYFELVVGALLVLGLFTSLAAAIVSAMLASFIFAVGVFPDPAQMIFNKDLILLGSALALICCGSGSLSLDKLWSSS